MVINNSVVFKTYSEFEYSLKYICIVMMVQLNMYSGIAVRMPDFTKKVELTRVLLDAFSTVLYECTLSQSAITLSLLPSLK